LKTVDIKDFDRILNPYKNNQFAKLRLFIYPLRLMENRFDPAAGEAAGSNPNTDFLQESKMHLFPKRH
jgi:hypothetical protein